MYIYIPINVLTLIFDLVSRRHVLVLLPEQGITSLPAVADLQPQTHVLPEPHPDNRPGLFVRRAVGRGGCKSGERAGTLPRAGLVDGLVEPLPPHAEEALEYRDDGLEKAPAGAQLDQRRLGADLREELEGLER